MPFYSTRSFPFLVLAAILTVAACCERPQPGAAKTATAGANPVLPTKLAPMPVLDRYPATLADGIDLTRPGYPSSLTAVGGLSSHESWGRWSDGSPVVLQFTQPLPNRFKLILIARAFGPNAGVPITIKAGTSEQTVTLTADDQTHRLDFTLPEPTDRLELHIPRPTSPADLNQSPDARKLGIGLVKLRLEPADLVHGDLGIRPF